METDSVSVIDTSLLGPLDYDKFRNTSVCNLHPVHSAAERHWREAGATSARAAVSVYTAIYRRRWGCETALQGARLRLSRAYLAAGGDARRARGAAHPTFDPGDADHFAAAASPVLRGLPAGQRD